MALQLSIEHETGIILNYWKISTTDICWYIGEMRITIDGYVNYQARLDGKVPLGCKIYEFIDTDFHIEPTDNFVHVCYEKLKTLPEWSGSIDV